MTDRRLEAFDTLRAYERAALAIRSNFEPRWPRDAAERPSPLQSCRSLLCWGEAERNQPRFVNENAAETAHFPIYCQLA